MAISKIFNGVTIRVPGHYGGPVVPSIPEFAKNMKRGNVNIEDADAIQLALRALHQIIPGFDYCHTRQFANETIGPDYKTKTVTLSFIYRMSERHF